MGRTVRPAMATTNPEAPAWTCRCGQVNPWSRYECVRCRNYRPRLAFDRRTCWRCGGQGFVRGPCQVCGRWRTGTGEIAHMAGSLWGDNPPPAQAKPRRKGHDW
jgi:hypothetical protein